MRTTILFAIATLLAACSSDKVAGTGSQTGNSVVAGRLLRSDAATPDTGDTVLLRSATWTGDTSDAPPRFRITDTLGRYRFEEVPPGLWTLESRDRQKGWKRTFRVAPERDTVLPDAILATYGALVVEVHLDDDLKRGTLAVLGRDSAYSLMTGARTIFVTIRNLSPGIHTLVIRSEHGSFLQQAIVKVAPGATDSVDFTAWSPKQTDPAEDEPDGDDDDNEAIDD